MNHKQIIDTSRQGLEEREDRQDIDISRPLDELLDKFPHRHQEIIDRFIVAKRGEDILLSLKKFADINQVVLIKQFIEARELNTVLKHFDQFSGLTAEIAHILIFFGYVNTVVDHIEQFSDQDHEAIAYKCIEIGRGSVVVNNLSRFSGLDHMAIADKLIYSDQAEVVEEGMEKFLGLDYVMIAHKLMSVGKAKVLARCLNRCSGLSADIADRLIREGYVKDVGFTIQSFESFHREAAVKLIEAGDGHNVAYFLEKFKDIDYKDIAYRLIKHRLGGTVAECLHKFNDLDHVYVATCLIDNDQGEYIDDFFENFSGLHKWIIERIGETYFEKYKNEIRYLFCKNEQLILDRADFAYAEQNNLFEFIGIFDITYLKKQRRSLEDFSAKDDESCEALFEVLGGNAPDWQDPQITERFRAGAELFGYKKMLRYAVPGHRHDALYAFDRVLQLRDVFGVAPNEFFHNILLQVAMDGGSYGEDGKTSFQMLNDAVAGLNTDVSDVLDRAKEIEGIPQLQKLLEQIRRPQDVVSSWKMFLQYKELTTYVERRELLVDLGREDNERLKNYVATLLFHPSIANTRAVELFWRDPRTFLGLDSSHTSAEVHDRKKPSNYIDIPNLDLSAVDMRDALVEGSLDRIQVWTPMEVVYEIPVNPNDAKEYREFSALPIEQVLRDFLGPQGADRGIRQKNKLFGQIREMIEARLDTTQFPQVRKTAGNILKALVLGGPLPDGVAEFVFSEEDEETIRRSVYFGGNGLGREEMKVIKYKVKINAKSDPDGVVAGSDTQCCMPFGDGKNTLYTYNPVCALMTVQRETSQSNGEQGWRTIAQSVLTKDRDVHSDIASIVGNLDADDGVLSGVLPQEILHREDAIIACDSVEVANNFRTTEYSQLIADLYRDFLAQYTERFGEEQRIRTDRAVTGSCSYNLAGTRKERNTFLPASPVAYSDKYHSEVHVLDLQGHNRETFFMRRLVAIGAVGRTQQIPLDTPNIEYLTFEDALETAYIEGKAYSGTSLKEGIASMENALIAKDINNAQKGRGNMSVKYVSSEGQMQAYLLAYEGVYGYTAGDEDASHDKRGERCIYVMDLAKLPEAEKGTGGKLIEQFIALYGRHYIERGDLIPIKAEAREVSSYKMIVRNLNAWGESIGIQFELEEGGSFTRGEDTMHPVTIRPRVV